MVAVRGGGEERGGEDIEGWGGGLCIEGRYGRVDVCLGGFLK